MAKKKKKKQQPKTIVKKKGGFFGKLLAFLMGILMGIVGGFGGLAAIVFLVLNNTIKDTADTVESLGVTLPDLTEYITEDFANYTLLEAIQTVSGKIGGIANGGATLQDLVNDSPFLAEQVSGWAEFLTGYGVPATEEELLGLNIPAVPDYLSKKVNSISLASLLSNFGGAPSAENGLLCALLYGKKGVHYTVTEENTVELLPRAYIFNSDDNYFTDWDDNVYYWWQDPQAGLSGWALEENATFYITELDVPVISEADETVYYTHEIRAVDSDSDFSNDVVLYMLSRDPEDTNRYLVYENDELFMHTGLTIGQITQGEGIMSVVNKMELFTLLNMNESTDKIMLALAGYEKLEDGTIQVKENGSPTTIESLMSGAGNLINGMYVADLLTIDSNNSLMVALAYKDSDLSQPRTIADLTGDTNFVNELYVADVLGIDATSNKLMLSLAYEEGYSINDNGTPNDKEDDFIENGTKKKISSLTDADLMNNLYVADVLDVTPTSNKLILSLAYESYEIDDKGTPETGDDVFSSLGAKKTINSLTDANLINDLEMATVLDLNGSSNPVILSLAYGDGYLIEEETNKVYTLEADGQTKNYSSKKLSELTGTDNPVNDMKLSTLLGLTADSDPIMLSLAYGNYTIDDKGTPDNKADDEIIPEKDGDDNDINRTVGEFTANASTIMQSMQLSTALKLDASSNSLILALAYGNDYIKDTETGKVYTIGPDGQPNYNSKAVADLTNPDSNLLNDLSIANALSLNANSDPIMLSLAYGNYKIDDGEIVPEKDGAGNNINRKMSDLTGQNGAQDIVQSLKLPVVLGLDESSDPLMLKIAYGDGYITNPDGSVTLDETKARDVAALTAGNFIDDLTLGDVIEIGEDSPEILNFLKDATLGDDNDPATKSITEKIDEITLVDVLGEEQCNGNKLLSSMSTWKVNEFGTNVNKLTLGEVIDTSSGPKLLKALSDATLGDDGDATTLTITERINTLQLGEMMDVGDNFILKHLTDSTLDTLARDISDLTIEDVFASDVYDENGEMKGTWKYLLTDNTNQKHKLTDMNALITNMTTNIQKATLDELNADGILSLSNLDQTILGTDIRIGSLTIGGLLGKIPTNKTN